MSLGFMAGSAGLRHVGFPQNLGFLINPCRAQSCETQNYAMKNFIQHVHHSQHSSQTDWEEKRGSGEGLHLNVVIRIWPMSCSIIPCRHNSRSFCSTLILFCLLCSIFGASVRKPNLHRIVRGWACEIADSFVVVVWYQYRTYGICYMSILVISKRSLMLGGSFAMVWLEMGASVLRCYLALHWCCLRIRDDNVWQ